MEAKRPPVGALFWSTVDDGAVLVIDGATSRWKGAISAQGGKWNTATVPKRWEFQDPSLFAAIIAALNASQKSVAPGGEGGDNCATAAAPTNAFAKREAPPTPPPKAPLAGSRKRPQTDSLLSGGPREDSPATGKQCRGCNACALLNQQHLCRTCIARADEKWAQKVSADYEAPIFGSG